MTSLPTTRRHRLLVLAAAAFYLYLVLLLANAYQSHGQLRAAAEMRLLVESQQTATLMSDFLADQKNFVLDLVEAQAIETFLVNKALGMSMRYGLNANLSAIEESFRRKLAQKRLLGAPVYERLLYFDEKGLLIVDTNPGHPVEVPLSGHDPVPQLIFDEDNSKILAAAPVDYHGQSGGIVVTISTLDLLSRYLTSSTANLGFWQFLITKTRRILTDDSRTPLGGAPSATLAGIPPQKLIPISELPNLAATPLAADFDLVLRIPVAHTELSVITALPASLLYGHITSRRFLYFASSVPPILLLSALWISHMRQRTQRLEADVRESNRDRAELKDRNDALTAEMARRQTLERRLRESEERYRMYIEHAPEGIFVSDKLGRFVDANPSACAMVGYSHSELLRMVATDLSPPDQVGVYVAAFKQILANGRHELEITLCRKEGNNIVGSLRAITLPGDLIMGFCTDITVRKLAEEQIHNLAYFDPLTELPNRRLFLDRLRQTMVVSRRYQEYGALLMIDLDHFKDLNDTLGHDIGDRLLAEVARRLTASVRGEDTVARLGGDEYVIVAGELGTDESGAALLAEQIHCALGQPYVLVEGRRTYHSSASIGVTLFCGQEIGVELLLKQADVALYQAKYAGRDTIRFFNPDMQAAIDARAALETALRRALTSDELCLYFQPQVDRDGRVIGARTVSM